MSMRNKLRGPHQEITIWYNYIQQGMSLAAHASDPNEANRLKFLACRDRKTKKYRLKFLACHDGKSALLALAAHDSDPKEADRLTFLASCDGKDEYAEWIFPSKRSCYKEK
nr:cytochrome P450 reductase [Tanacetum cinerariifolium]